MHLLLAVLLVAALIFLALFVSSRRGPFGALSLLECHETFKSDEGVELHLVRLKPEYADSFEKLIVECSRHGFVSGQEEDLEYALCNPLLPIGVSIYFMINEKPVVVHTQPRTPHEKQILDNPPEKISDRYSFFGVIKKCHAKCRDRQTALLAVKT